MTLCNNKVIIFIIPPRAEHSPENCNSCTSRQTGLSTLNTLLYKDNTFLFIISSTFSMFSTFSKYVSLFVFT